MIKAVTVTNHLGNSIKLELMFPEKSGFVVQEITGLGPGKADINTTELSTNDGSIYTSARVNSRNIVFKLKPLFAPTVEDARHQSYKYFPIKKRINLLFETDSRVCEIYGYVESNEPNIFSKDVTTQVSIICPDPYFYSAGEQGVTTTIFNGIDPMFEFPFSNESLSDDLIEFGKLKTETEQSIYYTGDAEVGIIITVKALGEVSNLEIYNAGTRTSMRIDTNRLAKLTGHGIINGDEIVISTVKGSKYITLYRDGVQTNILNCLDKDADWFQLSTGDNLFAYTTDYGVEHLHFKIENQTVFEGV